MFIIGFGRSGTSALTRVLSLCGAALPKGLLGATGSNPRGYWEPRAAIHLNEEILRRQGSDGYDVSLRSPGERILDADAEAACIAKIRAYLTTLPAAPLVVLKEPKMTALTDLWFEAARQAGFDVAVVIAIRHPAEVIASIGKRAGRQLYVSSSPELVSASWLRYTLLAERGSRGMPRVFVEYSNLLENWRREVKRISTALAIDLDACDEQTIDEFLTSDLRHHRHGGPVAEPFGTDWASVVYETLSAASRDEPWDEAELDRVFEAYRVSERGFRAVFTDVRRYHNLTRLMPLPLVKLGLSGLALVHRRRGTWA
ncbi:sulfotransferase family protein [Mycolicibacterium pulveris]|uniref:sulfotransferase family protein n=1 Tax=Mycolicibacterium pulveris TaxID=36813 RepID=UPI003CF534EF